VVLDGELLEGDAARRQLAARADGLPQVIGSKVGCALTTARQGGCFFGGQLEKLAIEQAAKLSPVFTPHDWMILLTTWP
jgi:hypothetical protein